MLYQVHVAKEVCVASSTVQQLSGYKNI